MMAQSYADKYERAEKSAAPLSKDSAGFLDLHNEMLSVMEGIVASVPSLHAMGVRVAAMRARLDEMRNPK